MNHVEQLKRFIELVEKALKEGAKFKRVSARRFEYGASTRYSFYKLVVDTDDPTTFEFYGAGDTYLTHFTLLDPLFDDEPELLHSLEKLVDRIRTSSESKGVGMTELIGRFNESLELHIQDYLPKRKS